MRRGMWSWIGGVVVLSVVAVGVAGCGSSKDGAESSTGAPQAGSVVPDRPTAKATTGSAKTVDTLAPGCINISKRALLRRFISTKLGVFQCLTVVNGLPWPITIEQGDAESGSVYAYGRGIRTGSSMASSIKGSLPIQPGGVWSMAMFPGSASGIAHVKVDQSLSIEGGLVNAESTGTKLVGSLVGAKYQMIDLLTKWYPFSPSSTPSTTAGTIASTAATPTTASTSTWSFAVNKGAKDESQWIGAVPLATTGACGATRYAVGEAAFLITLNTQKLPLDDLKAQLPQLGSAISQIEAFKPSVPDLRSLIAKLPGGIPGQGSMPKMKPCGSL